jgi:hypothetical protein
LLLLLFDDLREQRFRRQSGGIQHKVDSGSVVTVSG